MLALRDPEVEGVFRWFEQCYDLEVHPLTGQGFWRRVALPREGGIGNQDARLLNALTCMAETQQQVLHEDTARRLHKDRAQRNAHV